MPNTKFTDNNLKLFYHNFLKHYVECTEKHQGDVAEIYYEMYCSVQHTVESEEGSLSG